MLTFFQKIIDAVLPPRCIKCGKILNGEPGLCPECFNRIDFISKPYCSKCGIPFEKAERSDNLLCGKCIKEKRSPFRMNRSAMRYDDNSKNLVLSFKFMDRTENAAVLAKWMKIAGEDIWAEGVDVLVPVPLHYTRLIKRKYNQSALLCAELSKLTGIPVNYNSVVRHLKTRPQVEFSGKERVRNIKGAFCIRHPEQIQGKRVVLVDDVMTTGSTLKECASVIKKAGAASVDTLTAARVCK